MVPNLHFRILRFPLIRGADLKLVVGALGKASLWQLVLQLMQQISRQRFWGVCLIVGCGVKSGNIQNLQPKDFGAT